MHNMSRLEKKLTSKSLKNKCVSAKLKIISSILRPNDTDVGGSWKNKEKRNHLKLSREMVFYFKRSSWKTINNVVVVFSESLN